MKSKDEGRISGEVQVVRFHPPAPIDVRRASASQVIPALCNAIQGIPIDHTLRKSDLRDPASRLALQSKEVLCTSNTISIEIVAGRGSASDPRCCTTHAKTSLLSNIALSCEAA